ncbi:MAG TPA: hypothetical protein VGH19_07555 [Verrucomicrobiae bacterium]
MKHFIAFAFLCISVSAFADDAAIATQLQALGGKIKTTGTTVTEVTFNECSKLGETEFKAIGQLKGLKSLTLYNNCTNLNDASLLHIAGLTELESFGSDRINVTDEGLKPLAQLKNLRTASFFHTSFGKKGFTGVGFGYLKDCPKLERMTVAGISMGDEGFAAIATITQLKDFSTWHTYQTEAGNDHIAKLTNLKSLRIGQRLPRGGAPKPVSLSDASLPKFTKLASLETLRIGESRFTPEGLKVLKALPKLKLLNLWEVQITEADVEKVKKDFPNVKVEWQPLTDEQRKRLENYLKE